MERVRVRDLSEVEESVRLSGPPGRSWGLGLSRRLTTTGSERSATLLVSTVRRGHGGGREWEVT
jgi:hypothetical protein